MSKISYIKLGATLFVPAMHKSLQEITNEHKYPELKSVVIDTEDGIKASQLDEAYEKIKKLLKNFVKSKLLIFIRVRNTQVLEKLLAFKNIEKIDGFLLAKFSLANAQNYMGLLKNTHYAIMPSIEGEELFNHAQLHELKELLLKDKEKIVLIRYGLEDMLRQLGMRRECDESVFDICVTASVLGNFIATFKSAGFAVSGGVYPCFKDKEGFVKDVKRDLKEGLFSKTIIHPSQIEIINELYKVSEEELKEAVEITQHTDGVFGQNSKMAEVKTMTPYSKEIILRAKEYGVLTLP